MSMNKHFLYPGTMLVSRGLTRISTILGSCVAVCLWDPVRTIGGINHYILPYWNGEGLPTPRYGNVAITRLCEQMQCHGSGQGDLVARSLEGRASMPKPADCFWWGTAMFRLPGNVGGAGDSCGWTGCGRYKGAKGRFRYRHGNLLHRQVPRAGRTVTVRKG